MKDFIKYFEEYYTKNYNGYEFEYNENTFSCKFPDDFTYAHKFEFKLLSEESYQCMALHGVLDRYLEIMRVRYATTEFTSLARKLDYDYEYFFVEKDMVDKADEWMAYVTSENLDSEIALPNYTLLLVNTDEPRKDKRIAVYNNDTYHDSDNAIHIKIPYYGEIEFIDSILSER